MHFTIYKVTNKLNNRFYIGKHQTRDLNDGYMGSGVHIKRAIIKYGIQNFDKEILFVFDNETEMNAKEADIVTLELCLSESTYNICPGGNGGFGYINSLGLNLRTGMIHSAESKEKISRANTGKLHSEYTKKKCSDNNWAKSNPIAHKKHISSLHKGKIKSKEHKEKISNKLKNSKKEITVCPHCKIEGAKPIMIRWHFSNCKARV